MSNTRETRLTRRIRATLKGLGAKTVKFHGSGFTEEGTPDVLGCYKGRALALEIKLPGEEATPIQLKRLAEWQIAGAITGVVRSIEETRELIREADKQALVDTSERFAAFIRNFDRNKKHE